MSHLFELHPDEPRVKLLCEADPRFTPLVRRTETLAVKAGREPFEFLVRSLIGQQLSVGAAATICRRVEACCGGLAPEAIIGTEEERLRGCGVSRPKISYMKGLAELVRRGEIDFAAMGGLEDDETVERLTAIKGIGRWTAEMFLIFFLGREDVLSLGDAGLRRALGWLYGESERIDAAALERHARQWQPYRTIASLYLWEAINRGMLKEA